SRASLLTGCLVWLIIGIVMEGVYTANRTGRAVMSASFSGFLAWLPFFLVLLVAWIWRRFRLPPGEKGG
ncbi:MAG TPA: hypothetical protein VKC60_01495, partial [Opitutaceae bacterium]|nr:hypothetical protein [Opitutaceae bacterium]